MSHIPRPTTESLREQYKSALHNFTASSESFQVIDTLTSQEGQAAATAATTGANTQTPASALYVLDSSFNPPTLAHLHIAKSALISFYSSFSVTDQHVPRTARLLLLLATQNADKPTKPALFEDRLVMMNLFGRDLLDSLGQTYTNSSKTGDGNDDGNSSNGSRNVAVDIGVTPLPYFIDKASSISLSNIYAPPDIQQIHLTGYDTLIRIFEPKYYPPSHTLEPLTSFLERHRLRVTMRPDDGWGGGEDQTRFLEGLRGGALEAVGGKKEWAGRIEMVEGITDGEKGAVSSTRARALAVAGDREGLARLVTARVAAYMSPMNTPNHIYSTA